MHQLFQSTLLQPPQGNSEASVTASGALHSSARCSGNLPLGSFSQAAAGSYSFCSYHTGLPRASSHRASCMLCLRLMKHGGRLTMLQLGALDSPFIASLSLCWVISLSRLSCPLPVLYSSVFCLCAPLRGRRRSRLPSCGEVVTCHLHCCTVLIEFQDSSTHTSPPNCWVVVAGVSVLVCLRSCLVAACAAREIVPKHVAQAPSRVCRRRSVGRCITAMRCPQGTMPAPEVCQKSSLTQSWRRAGATRCEALTRIDVDEK